MEPLSVDTNQNTLSYTDPSSQIKFDSVQEVGVGVGALLSVKNNYVIDDNTNTITRKQKQVLNAIDIDWDGAIVSDELESIEKLNTTGDLIKWIKDVKLLVQ